MPTHHTCGTPAGYARHARRGEPKCGPCINARSEYAASLYATDEGRRELAKARNRARNRARTALKDNHPEEYALARANAEGDYHNQARNAAIDVLVAAHPEEWAQLHAEAMSREPALAATKSTEAVPA